MTPPVVSLGLLKVHLMVAVEGQLLQKWFHASPNLAYTYIWDKTDAYGQRVYGLSQAVGECAFVKCVEIVSWKGRYAATQILGILSKGNDAPPHFTSSVTAQPVLRVVDFSSAPLMPEPVSQPASGGLLAVRAG